MLLLWRLTVNLLLVWLDLSTCSYLIKLTMLIWFEPIGFFSTLYNKAATPPPLHKWTVLALNPLSFSLQVLGRNFILFVIILHEENIQSAPLVFFLLLTWSLIEVVR